MASNDIYPPGPVPTIFGGRKLTCDECGFSTRIKDSLVKHINSFHLKINDQDEGACGSLSTAGHDIDPAQRGDGGRGPGGAGAPLHTVAGPFERSGKGQIMFSILLVP